MEQDKHSNTFHEADVKLFLTLFSLCGHCEEAPEKYLHAITSLSGSGTAFVRTRTYCSLAGQTLGKTTMARTELEVHTCARAAAPPTPQSSCQQLHPHGVERMEPTVSRRAGEEEGLRETGIG